jgi:hypothetical protein
MVTDAKITEQMCSKMIKWFHGQWTDRWLQMLRSQNRCAAKWSNGSMDRQMVTDAKITEQMCSRMINWFHGQWTDRWLQMLRAQNRCAAGWSWLCTNQRIHFKQFIRIGAKQISSACLIIYHKMMCKLGTCMTSNHIIHIRAHIYYISTTVLLLSLCSRLKKSVFIVFVHFHLAQLCMLASLKNPLHSSLHVHR